MPPGLRAERLEEAETRQAEAQAEAQRLQQELSKAQAELSQLREEQAIAPKQPKQSTPDYASDESDEDPAQQRTLLGPAPPPTPGDRVALSDLPVREGAEADSFGMRPSPMNGGNNNYMQFRRHFRVVTASLFRKLHGVTSSSPIDVIRLATLEGERCACRRWLSGAGRSRPRVLLTAASDADDACASTLTPTAAILPCAANAGMLWMAVKCYMAELLLGAERGACALDRPNPISIARAKGDLDKVKQLMKELKDASKNAVGSALEMEMTAEVGVDVASLMRCMRVSGNRRRVVRVV